MLQRVKNSDIYKHTLIPVHILNPPTAPQEAADLALDKRPRNGWHVTACQILRVYTEKVKTLSRSPSLQSCKNGMNISQALVYSHLSTFISTNTLKLQKQRPRMWPHPNTWFRHPLLTFTLMILLLKLLRTTIKSSASAGESVPSWLRN